MYAVVFCFKRKIFSGDVHTIVQMYLMPAASHNHEPESTSGIYVSWEDHSFSLSLPVLGVISFSCTISKCFFFSVFHTAVCFATCFPVLLKPRGSGCISFQDMDKPWWFCVSQYNGGICNRSFLFVATSLKEHNRTKSTL